MKIRATATKTTRTEIDVTLPVYRQYDDTYERIDESFQNGRTSLRCVTVRFGDLGEYESGQRVEIEINQPYEPDAQSPPDWHQGTGDYASSPEQFADAVARARKILANIL